jgi:hypothetical protein
MEKKAIKRKRFGFDNLEHSRGTRGVSYAVAKGEIADIVPQSIQILSPVA